MGWIILFISIFLIITILINFICCKLESKKLDNSYGKFVEINGEKICVDISGNGDKVVVLLSGAASPSPVLEMASLTENLKDEYIVITIEYLGYGLSDVTYKERTIENITQEVHSVLQSLGYSRYTLMVHSISGAYGLYYSNQYADEVETFVGIDSSVPKQIEYMHSEKINVIIAHLYRFAKITGILRLLSRISPKVIVDNVNGYKRSQEDTKLLRILYLNKLYNTSVMNELNNSTDNFEKAKDFKFPEEIPVLFFLASQSCGALEQWYALHEEIITDKKQSQIITLEGSHYLHYQYSKEIINTFKEWIADK